MTRNNYAGCFIYARMSAADIKAARTKARAQADGDKARLGELLDELVAAKITDIVRDCRRYAEDEGWPVLGVYTDNMVSGNARYRNKGQRLTGRDALEADLRERRGQRVIVLSTEIARLYRDMKESRVLVDISQYTPVTLMTTDGEPYDLSTPEGEARFEGAVSQAQRESAVVSRRRRSQERRRAEKGGYWGTEPFGYHKVYDTDEDGQRYYTGRLELCTGSCCPLAGRPGCAHHGSGCWLDPARQLKLGSGFWITPAGDDDDAPDEAGSSGPLGETELTVLAARALTRGASLASVVRQWQNLGVTTRNGERWSQMMLRDLLLNKRLAGIRVHRAGDKWGRADRDSEGTEQPGLWPATLDDETFAAVRGVLTAPERYKHIWQGSARGVRRHLLAGLAECGRIWGPEGGVREGTACGARMTGRPAPPPRTPQGERLEDQSRRGRQYQCPKVHGGCGKCRRNAGMADDWVIECIRAWTEPGGVYETFLARETAQYEAHQAAVAGELALIEAEQAVLTRERETVDATRKRALRSGALQHGTDEWRLFAETFREIDDRKAELGARTAKLLSAAPPPSPDDLRRDLARLYDPGEPVTVRADLVRRFVAKVIIYPPGQGVRTFDLATVEVVPGPWADGLDITAPAPAGQPAARPRDAVLAYLAEHPWSTPDEIGAGVSRGRASLSRVLITMRGAGEIVTDRPPFGGRRIRYALPGTDAPAELA